MTGPLECREHSRRAASRNRRSKITRINGAPESAADGQQRIVGQHCADADADRVDLGADGVSVRLAACRVSASASPALPQCTRPR